MKLRFKRQQYQADAVDAIARVFTGQTKGHRKETVGWTGMFVDEIFSNKKIELDKAAIQTNVQLLQREQGLPVQSTLESLDFTVEMETGTGKTYVYTKAMFELNHRYGWSKFIIMVPSVAIREGVFKSLQITESHFQEEYGQKLRFFVYDTKNKSNIANIKNYANSAKIEVVVMNYQAFASSSKDSRKIFQELDEMQTERPIDVLKRVRPVLIIDEPQRFGDKAEKMLGEFDPLFTLRFSATHKKDFAKIFRLDAIDAFNQKLVKKIRVKGIEVRGNVGTNSYLFLDQIHVSSTSYPSATVQMEIETKQSAGIKRALKRINERDDLQVLSGGLQQYRGYVVSEINAKDGVVRFTNGVEIAIGQVLGDVDEQHLRRIQIREAIKSHLEKERELFGKRIKVLTLFFIDEVAKYRTYDDAGNQIRSEYERVFEEEYLAAIQEQELFEGKYRAYLEKNPVELIHNGYFSVDKKGRAINSKESRGQEGSDDASAYDLIMKKKEQLLSFDEPTRFIFSHSALREGWDNPNIFQICTLKHAQAEISKRQEIGRGLRIAVNDDGERMDHGVLGDAFFDVNTLTVIASESYDSFAQGLQKEIHDSLKGRPVKLESSVFKDVALKKEDSTTEVLTDRKIRHLLGFLEEKGYVDGEDHVTQEFIDARDNDSLEFPEEFKPLTAHIVEIISKVHTTKSYRAAEDERAHNVHERDYKPNENFKMKEFQELWGKIKAKTVYEVDFDSEELIRKSVNEIDSKLAVRKVTVLVTQGEQAEHMEQEALREGEGMKKTARQMLETEGVLGSVKYDLIGEIAAGAHITRKTAVMILQAINPLKFSLFAQNPEDFIRGVVDIINVQKAATLIDKVTYIKTSQTYEDDVFIINNLRGSLNEDVLAVNKHVYGYVKTDSKTERDFVKGLDLDDNKVVVYAKLPRGLKIPTPVGNYSPDWAIVFDDKEVKHIYFVAETKGSMSTLQLKNIEEQKIAYARKHFEELSKQGAVVRYDVVDSFERLMDKVMQ